MAPNNLNQLHIDISSKNIHQDQKSNSFSEEMSSNLFHKNKHFHASDSPLEVIPDNESNEGENEIEKEEKSSKNEIDSYRNIQEKE